MLKFINLTYLILCYTCLFSQDPKIVGGQETPVSEFPWNVYLEADTRSSCSSVYLGDGWLMTSAHCVSKTWDDYLFGFFYQTDVCFDVIPQPNRVSIKEVYIHPEYGKYAIGDPKDNIFCADIAIIKIRDFTNVTESLRSIDYGQYQPGRDVTFFGWGKLDNNLESCTLHSVNVTQPDYYQTCGGNFGMLGFERNAGANHGDSGGPAVIFTTPDNDPLLIGIIKYTIRNDQDIEFTTFIENVSDYDKWIQQVISGKYQPTYTLNTLEDDTKVIAVHADEDDSSNNNIGISTGIAIGVGTVVILAVTAVVVKKYFYSSNSENTQHYTFDDVPDLIRPKSPNQSPAIGQEEMEMKEMNTRGKKAPEVVPECK